MARSVVRGNHYERVLIEAGLTEILPDPADACIGVHDEVTVYPDRTLALEAGFGRTGRMGSRQPDEEEKGLFLFRLAPYEFPRFVTESGEDFGIEEILGGGSDPVKGAPTLLSGYLTLPFLSPDVGIGEHVEGTGQKKTVVEPIIRGADLDGLGEIGVLGTLHLAVLGGHACTQVPFADVARRITALPEHMSNGMLGSREAQADEAPWSASFPFAESKSVATRHDGGPAGYADRVGYVGVGKLHTLFAETIEVRSVDFGLFATEGLDVSIAQVVGENEDYVWPFGGRQKDAPRKEDNERKQSR